MWLVLLGKACRVGTMHSRAWRMCSRRRYSLQGVRMSASGEWVLRLGHVEPQCCVKLRTDSSLSS